MYVDITKFCEDLGISHVRLSCDGARRSLRSHHGSTLEGMWVLLSLFFIFAIFNRVASHNKICLALSESTMKCKQKPR